MNPFLLLVLAILTPFILIAVLLVPPYAGIYGAAYLIYDQGAVDPLASRYLDLFYIIDVYGTLLGHWMRHMGEVSFLHYSLPIIALPLLGLVLGLWLTRRIARKLMDLFHLSVSHH